MLRLFLQVVTGLMFLVEASAVERPHAVIFDLDDTIFDTNCRTLAVLQEVGRELDLKPLQNLTYEQVDYYCKTTVERTGLKDPALLETICGDPKQGTLTTSEWGKRFFRDPAFLQHDCIMPGAVDFVASIAERLDAVVLYLSGRSAEALGEGTEAQLAHHRLYGYTTGALDTTLARIYFKPDADTSEDDAFKRQQLAKIRKQFVIRAVFDDSRRNVNMFRTELPDIIPIIRPIRNILTRDDEAPGILRITNYLYDCTLGDDGRVAVVSSNQALLKDLLNEIVATPAASY
ncbi:MAG: hypothetical protein A2284_09120 [Deltaproteobacteria bacterium RIFOXYA12_FULL_61_11]|nr:MAG: hypothetical protein A2284_09120 [Deltaproteobacteria bacterium RIFOXYA12_FULL_61_11]